MKHFTIPLALLLLPACANAALVFNVYDEGDDIVIHAYGTANLDGLTFDGTVVSFGQLSPGLGSVGVANSSSGDSYGSITGPTSFGPELGLSDFTARSGDTFRVFGGTSQLIVPVGYVSGNPLEGMARFTNYSLDFFFNLPVGSSFEWTWGSGANADSAQVNITTAPALPLPPTLALFGLGALAAGITRRRCRRAASR